MKKRNIIFLVIDTLSYKVLSEYPFKKELFINNYIRMNSISYENVFTQGPYTEASMNGLAYGQRGLDGSSFMFSHSQFTHSFLDNIHQDYSTFCAGMSCRLFIDHCFNSFDSFHYHFYSPMVFPTLNWNRIVHFKKIFKERVLERAEYDCLFALIEYSFSFAISFLNDLKNNGYRTSLSKNYIDKAEAVRLKNLIANYYTLFKKNKKSFTDSVLNGDIDLTKFDIKYHVPYNNYETVKRLYDYYRPKLIKEFKKHYKINHTVLKWALNNFKQSRGIKDLINLQKNTFAFPKKTKEQIAVSYEKSLNPEANFKSPISFNRSLIEIKKFILNNSNNSSKPFFIYCQPDDFHPLSIFWTYDSTDAEIIKNDLESALKLIKRIKTKNCNIFNFLSINYVDKKIKDLFDFLEANKLLDSTDVILTADHGSWNYENTFRTNNLIMTEERMHIPCLFFRKGINPEQKFGLYNSYSIPNSILKFEGYETDSYFYGKSFEQEKNKYLLAENLGFGCPDIYNVPIQYTVHNRKYKLVINCMIDQNITLDNCVEFYNLDKDKDERLNIIKTMHRPDKIIILNEMFAIAEKRHLELQKTYTKKSFYNPNII